ncbi:MAG: DUF2155 domain-containing protein [Pseudolabrys sp.]|nr:DUF2155 domain-containing protein [Pseudolabrys sp.]
MARSRLTAGLLAVVSVATVGGLMAVAPLPASAQFGGIFSDDPPPRPPGSVPRGGQQLQPPPPQYVPPERGRDARRPNYDADQPPSQPQAPPMALPPSSRPGGGAIQSQPLAPPPGGTAAPAPSAAPLQPAQPAAPGRQPPQAQPETAATAPQPGDEVVVAPPPQRIANPNAVFSGLDKITGRIISFDVAINETVQFGALQVTPRVCYTRPPTETPNTDAFIQVDEVTLQGEIKRIFEGWMFAASPGLHAVEHPIYDVWITDCKGGAGPEVAEAPAEPKPAAARPPAQRAPAQPGARPAQPRAQQQQPLQPGFAPAIR